MGTSHGEGQKLMAWEDSLFAELFGDLGLSGLAQPKVTSYTPFCPHPYSQPNLSDLAQQTANAYGQNAYGQLGQQQFRNSAPNNHPTRRAPPPPSDPNIIDAEFREITEPELLAGPVKLLPAPKESTHD